MFGTEYMAWEELRPKAITSSGIEIYNRASFGGRDHGTLAIPNQPKVIQVDVLRVGIPEPGKGIPLRTMGPSSVLTFHGQSTKRYWRQLYHPHSEVEDILREIEEEGVPLDALAICNPRGYELSLRDGTAQYTYSLENASVHGFILNDETLQTLFTSKMMFFKGESRLRTKL
jgi:hypothetical protein